MSGATGELAAWAGDQDGAVLALDAPTGLDVTTGTASPGAVPAAATMTLTLPKPGLLGVIRLLLGATRGGNPSGRR